MFPKFNSSTLALATCALVFFVSSLDSSIVGAVLPSIAKSYDISLIDTKTLLIGFLLSFTLSIPLVEFLVGRLGLRFIFMLSCIGFMVSSFLCGIANTYTTLIIARAIQGFSAGCFSPISRGLIVQNSPPDKLAINLTNIQTVGLLGQAFGPFFGGYIAHYFGWRYIFFINVPICIIILILSYISVHNKDKNRRLKMDFIGYFYIICILLGLMLLSTFVEEGNQLLYSLIGILLFVVFTGIIARLFILRLTKVKHPIINFRLLKKSPKFKLYTLCSLFTRQYLGANSFIIVIIGGTLFNYSAVEIGKLLLGYGFGVWFSKLIVKRLLKKYTAELVFKFATVLTFFYSLFGTSFLIFSSQTLWPKVIIVFIFGCFVSTVFGLLNVITYSSINRKESITASSITSLVMYTCQSTSIAIFAFLLHIAHQFLNEQHAIWVSNLLISLSLLFAIVILNFYKPKSRYI